MSNYLFIYVYIFRLSIATAHAFLITYAVDDRATFELVKGLFEEIREHRSDFDDIPIVVTGNKIDVGLVNRDVQYDEVCDWLECYWPSLRYLLSTYFDSK
jgi:hypothetical protein